MASRESRDIRKQLNRMMKCAICADTYHDPRILPCVHTYCLECIKGICRNRKVGDEVECPLCRTKFKIPDTGVEGLRKNFLVEQLKDVADTSNRSSHCEGCSVGVTDTGALEKKLATVLCVECSQRFCETCVNIHRRVRATRAHKLVEITAGKDVNNLVAKLASNYCDKHPEEQLKWFCYDCKATICVACFIESHKSHECSDLSKVADEIRKQLNDDVRRMRSAIVKCQQSVEEHRRMKTEFSGKVCEVEQEICERAEQLKQQIEQEKQNLLGEVEAYKKHTFKQIGIVVDDIEQHVSFVESLVDYTEELATKGTATDVTQQRDNVQDRTVKLVTSVCIQRAVSDMGSIDVTFTPTTWPTPASGNIVGRVNRNNVVTSTLDLTPVLSTWTPSKDSIRSSVESMIAQAHLNTKTKSAEMKSPSLTHVIPGSDPVASLTTLRNQLFVIRSPHRQQIEVYSTETFNKQSILKTEFLRDNSMCQLTSCGTNKCLYVSDRDTDTIYKVDVTGVDVSREWQVGSGPVGLSVNKVCNVLVTCDGDNTIEEYSPRGSMVLRIRFHQSDMYDLWHAVELSNGHYAVSHSGPVEGVSVVDRLGRVVSTYRKDEKSKTRLFIGPRYLAVSADDCVLVADKDNDRILTFNFTSTRTHELKLSLDGGLEGPYCLHLENSLGRLYVGEYDGKRTLVFDNVVNTSVQW